MPCQRRQYCRGAMILVVTIFIRVSPLANKTTPSSVGTSPDACHCTVMLQVILLDWLAAGVPQHAA